MSHINNVHLTEAGGGVIIPMLRSRVRAGAGDWSSPRPRVDSSDCVQSPAGGISSHTTLPPFSYTHYLYTIYTLLPYKGLLLVENVY